MFVRLRFLGTFCVLRVWDKAVPIFRSNVALAISHFGKVQAHSCTSFNLFISQTLFMCFLPPRLYFSLHLGLALPIVCLSLCLSDLPIFLSGVLWGFPVTRAAVIVEGSYSFIFFTFQNAAIVILRLQSLDQSTCTGARTGIEGDLGDIITSLLFSSSPTHT